MYIYVVRYDYYLQIMKTAETKTVANNVLSRDDDNNTKFLLHV